MAIHVGDDLRVTAEHSTWRVDERRVAAESGKERWEPVGTYVNLYEAFRGGVVGHPMLKAAGLQDEVMRCGDFVDAMRSLAYNMGKTVGPILDLAWVEARRQWQALGVEGVPEDPRTWELGVAANVWNVLKDDNEAVAVMNKIAILTNWDNLLRRMEIGPATEDKK